MKRSFWNAQRLAGLLAVTFAVGSAAAQPAGVARVDGPVFAPVGSSWTYAVRESGSLGAANQQRTTRSRGEQTWSGRKVHAYEGEQSTLLLDPTTGKQVARISGGTTIESWDPPLGLAWPLWLGKSWTDHFRYTNQRGQTSSVQGWFKVHAYEDVQVPAGNFKVFRVTYSDGSTEGTFWWIPELGISAKTRIQRTSNHSAGPGAREAELVSHDIKKQ